MIIHLHFVKYDKHMSKPPWTFPAVSLVGIDVSVARQNICQTISRILRVYPE